MKYLLASTIALLLVACEFKNIHTDEDYTRSTEGLTMKMNGLSCPEIFWESKHIQTIENRFLFGEEVKISFDHMKGLKLKNGKYRPEISILVVNSGGDTLVFGRQVPENLGKKPTVNLFASFVIGSLFTSNADYTAFVTIEDKNGSGSIDTKFRFEVIPNDKIKTVTQSARVKEVYLLGDGQEAILSGKVKKQQDIQLVMEGLDGFRETDGLADIGVSLTCKSARGKILFHIDDATENMTINHADLCLRLTSPGVKITEEGIGSFLLEVVVWDNQGPAKITSSVILQMEE